MLMMHHWQQEARLRGRLRQGLTVSERAEVLESLLALESYKPLLEVLTEEWIDHILDVTQSWVARKGELDFDPAEVEDMVQDALLHVLQAERFPETRPALGQWVRRQMYTYLREASQEPLLRARGCRSYLDDRQGPEEVRTCRDQVDEFPALPVRGSFPSEDDGVVAMAREVLRRAHPRGFERFWRIAWMYYFGGFSREEVAKAEGITVATLGNKLEKIRRSFRADPDLLGHLRGL